MHEKIHICGIQIEIIRGWIQYIVLLSRWVRLLLLKINLNLLEERLTKDLNRHARNIGKNIDKVMVHLLSQFQIAIAINHDEGKRLIKNRSMPIPIGCKRVQKTEHEIHGENAESF